MHNGEELTHEELNRLDAERLNMEIVRRLEEIAV
jgi:hypothetical protein